MIRSVSPHPAQGQPLAPSAQSNPDDKALNVFLRMIAPLGIGVGIVIAAASTISAVSCLGKAYLASDLGLKIFKIAAAILFPSGAVLLYISAALLMTPATALGATATLPLAAACFVLPFVPVLPAFLAAIPGAGISYASYTALKRMETEN